MKTKNLLLSVLTVSTIITLSACDGTSTAQTENNSPSSTTETPSEPSTEMTAYNSCDLLSINDVQEIFPEANVKITQQGDEANPIGQRICFYDASEDEMKFVQTSLIRTSDMSSGLQSSGQNAKSTFINSKDLVENAETINGLGQEAYYGGSGLTLGAGLNILVDNDTSLNITVGLGFGNKDDQAHLDAEKTLAEKILPQL